MNGSDGDELVPNRNTSHSRRTTILDVITALMYLICVVYFRFMPVDFVLMLSLTIAAFAIVAHASSQQDGSFKSN